MSDIVDPRTLIFIISVCGAPFAALFAVDGLRNLQKWHFKRYRLPKYVEGICWYCLKESANANKAARHLVDKTKKDGDVVSVPRCDKCHAAHETTAGFGMVGALLFVGVTLVMLFALYDIGQQIRNAIGLWLEAGIGNVAILGIYLLPLFFILGIPGFIGYLGASIFPMMYFDLVRGRKPEGYRIKEYIAIAPESAFTIRNVNKTGNDPIQPDIPETVKITPGGNYQGHNFEYRNLKNVDFTNANLTEANLSGANLSGANLKGATLVGAKMSLTIFDENTILPDGRNWRPTALISEFQKPKND